ncbi:hypothetical protein [Labrys miyagiensis]|uniref:hypothetical protein n=1 Tax=Labrys miyagiensis TaxID=346912 RepID=UPI0024E1523A|nr:hypothetical protein [Labrys miyagiensis]
MPTSSALSTTSLVSSGSLRRPKLLQPSPTSETRRPDLPIVRNSIAENPLEYTECEKPDRGNTATGRTN